MPLDFPTNPVNGQVYEGFIYDSVVGSWESTSILASLGARLSAIESRVPAGTLHQWTTATAPQGYLLCEGQSISRTQFASLFTAIGTLYGTGDGSTTFNLPDLRGNVPVGKSASGTFSTLNNKGGAETVVLNLTQIPPHTHVQDFHNHGQDAHNHALNLWVFNGLGASSGLQYGVGFQFNTGGNNVHGGGELAGNFNNATTATNQATTATNQNTGGGGAHNNLQPYIVLNYIIKT